MLIPQAGDALATEHAERGRVPVLVIDLCAYEEDGRCIGDTGVRS